MLKNAAYLRHLLRDSCHKLINNNLYQCITESEFDEYPRKNHQVLNDLVSSLEILSLVKKNHSRKMNDLFTLSIYAQIR